MREVHTHNDGTRNSLQNPHYGGGGGGVEENLSYIVSIVLNADCWTRTRLPFSRGESATYRRVQTEKKIKKATDVKILLRCTYNVNQSNTVQKLTFRGVLREILAFWKDLK